MITLAAFLSAQAMATPTACEVATRDFARAALILYKDPTAVDAARQKLSAFSLPVVLFDRNRGNLNGCLGLAIAVTEFPRPQLILERVGDLSAADVGSIVADVETSSLAKARFDLADGGECRRAVLSSAGCTPYLAEELAWRGRIQAFPVAGPKLNARDLAYWKKVLPALQEWGAILAVAPSRPKAIELALSRETLRTWILDEIFGNPDPRKWDVDAVAVAFVDARAEDRREAAVWRAHLDKLAAENTVEQISDGSACDVSPHTCLFLERVQRMGWGNASALLEAKSISPAPFRDGTIMLGCFGCVVLPFQHVGGEVALYQSEWTPEAGDQERYLHQRWLATDRAAPTPDLAVIRTRIREIEARRH